MFKICALTWFYNCKPLTVYILFLLLAMIINQTHATLYGVFFLFPLVDQRALAQHSASIA
jgi:hypothetical protein